MLRFEQILAESKKLDEENWKWHKLTGRVFFTNEEAGERIARIGRFFIHAHQQAKTIEQANELAKSLTNSLISVGWKTEEGSLKNILERSHGLQLTVSPTSYRNLSLKNIKDLWLYNYIHWSGIAQTQGVILENSGLQGYLKKQGIRLTKDGKINVTAKLARRLASITPHLVRHRFLGRLRINAQGSAKLTHAETFELLRDASNELRSLTLKKIAAEFNKALNNPAALQKAADELSDEDKIRKEYPFDTNESFSQEFLRKHADWAATSTDFIASRGFVNPLTKQATLEQLSRRDYAHFQGAHLNILAQACGMNIQQIKSIFASIPQNKRAEFFQRALPESKGKTELEITMKPSNNYVQVTGTGLGKLYAEFVSQRLGAGTSTPIRNLIAPNRTLEYTKNGTRAIPWPERKAA